MSKEKNQKIALKPRIQKENIYSKDSKSGNISKKNQMNENKDQIRKIFNLTVNIEKQSTTTLNQQHKQEFQNQNINYSQIQNQLIILRQSFVKYQQKVGKLTEQIQVNKQLLFESEVNLQQSEQKCEIVQQKLRLLQYQYNQSQQQFQEERCEMRLMQIQMKELLDRQNNQIRRLHEQINSINFQSKQNKITAFNQHKTSQINQDAQ